MITDMSKSNLFMIYKILQNETKTKETLRACSGRGLQRTGSEVETVGTARVSNEWIYSTFLSLSFFKRCCSTVESKDLKSDE